MQHEAWTAAKILIVDDEPASVRLLKRVLTVGGHREIDSTTDPREALDRFRAFHPDLVVLDLVMPHLDGVAVLEQIRDEIAPNVYLPVLIITADAAIEAKRRALAAGANDFLTKPFEPVEVMLRIGNLLATRQLYLSLDAHNRALEQTVRERTEQLLQTEKVAAMGSLLAGVAHELNNPLTILSGHAHLLQDAAVDDAVSRRATKIAEAAARCVRVARKFLALARQHPAERSAVRLGMVIHDAVDLLAYQLRADTVELTVDVADDLPPLWADRHQLHHVLVNLLGNAQYAMHQQSTPRRIAIVARYDVASLVVRLDVADTGPGVAPELRTKIFEPFFTTKPVGEGTGLGLTLCRGVIEDHGGTIHVDSESERGLRVRIALPIMDRKSAATVRSADTPARPLSPRSVLVVDDEPEFASVVAEAISRDGHDTAVATNGAVALEMLAIRPYDLVVSDTKMPVLDGEALYAELDVRFPALRERIIFLTGDVLNRDKRAFLERTGAPFLTKPCDLAELRKLVGQVLAAGGRHRPPA